MAASTSNKQTTTPKFSKDQLDQLNEEAFQLERYRNHVLNHEFGAREAKAIMEKYHFTIEADKLLETYQEVMKKNLALMQKQKEDMEVLKAQATMNSELIKNAIPE